MTDLRPIGANSNLLPALEPQVDIASFQTAYSFGTTNTTGSTVGYGTKALGGVVGVGAFAGQSVALADKRVQDAIVLYERDIRENVSFGNSNSVGTAVCKITTGGTKTDGFGWCILSILTMTIPNWFGMPMLYYNTELELEVEIQDCNGSTIGRYTGYGFKRIPYAAWHGYGGSFHVTDGGDGPRKSNIDAFKMAMAEIKSKIAVDYNRLKIELEECKK